MISIFVQGQTPILMELGRVWVLVAAAQTFVCVLECRHIDWVANYAYTLP